MAKNKKDGKTPIVNNLLPGAVGGAVGTITTMPIDTTKDTLKQFANEAAKLKQRVAANPRLANSLALQISHAEQTSKNLTSAAKYIHHTQGLKGFFRGTTGSLIKIVPAMAITFATGDAVRQKLEKRSDYDLERKIYEKFPRFIRETYDRALLGRIGDKAVSGEDKDVAKHVPYEKKNKYLVSRFLSNPITAGVGVAAGMAAFHKYHTPLVQKAYTLYKKIEHETGPVYKTLRNLYGNHLKDPETGIMPASLERIKEYTSKTPKEVRKSVASAGTFAAGGVALGRYLHPRALKSEAIMEKEQYHQRHPSEYIRTKLRDDVELKKGEGVIKSAMTKKANNILEKTALSPDLLQRAGAKALDQGEKVLNAGDKLKAVKRARQGVAMFATAHEQLKKNLSEAFGAMRRSYKS